MLSKFLIIFLITTASASAGTKLSVSKSFSYTSINDPDFYIVDRHESLAEDQLKSLSVGASYFEDNITTSISTNRLYNRSVKRSLINKTNKLPYLVKSNTTVDALSMGYIKGRYIASIILANVKIDKYLFYQGVKVDESSKADIMKGVSLGYFITKGNLITPFYMFDSSELNIRKVFGINYSYLF